MLVLKNLGIAARLYLVSFLLIASLTGVAITTWIALGEVAVLAQRTELQRVPQLTRIAAIELNVTRVSLQIRHSMLVRSPEDLAATLADIGEKRELIDDTLQEADKAASAVADRVFITKVTPLMKTFWEVGGENIRLIKEGKKEEAFDFLVSRTIPMRNQLLEVLGEEKTHQNGQLVAELEASTQHTSNTRLQLVMLVAAVAIGLMVFSATMSRMLRGRILKSQRVAERVRDGDLTQPVHDDARDEFSPLLRSLSDMQASLVRIVSSVRSSSEAVSATSAEIASGNARLSDRTDSQASALEGTAMSMRELDAAVRRNADNAQQANQLAQSASSVAAQGGEIVTQVVGTMREINDSSRKIADIISMIDSIAFQTNILALNAAVEAARAGEQGRGFAVVAGEVRSLASRSAAAAREIKQLIADSVERVDQGTALVDKAGATMSEIVDSIRHVRDIMGEISAASGEQSTGVDKVGAAVSHMDQSTQQNAALVEEIAAASAELTIEADELAQAVAVFKLANHRQAQ